MCSKTFQKKAGWTLAVSAVSALLIMWHELVHL